MPHAFEEMGIISFADADNDAEMVGDEAAGDEFDRLQLAHVENTLAAADQTSIRWGPTSKSPTRPGCRWPPGWTSALQHVVCWR
jgi:hypothetical protein